MLFMNRDEISLAVGRHASHPVLGPAATFLYQFQEMIDGCSDGWPYWSAGPRAAKNLMELIQSGEGETADLKKAIVPIKTFCTRQNRNGVTLPELPACIR